MSPSSSHRPRRMSEGSATQPSISSQGSYQSNNLNRNTNCFNSIHIGPRYGSQTSLKSPLFGKNSLEDLPEDSDMSFGGESDESQVTTDDGQADKPNPSQTPANSGMPPGSSVGRESKEDTSSATSARSRCGIPPSDGTEIQYKFTNNQEELCFTEPLNREKMNLNHIPPMIKSYIQSPLIRVERSPETSVGISLWYPGPEPTAAPHVVAKNISLGDVGFFSADGRYRTLFNIFMSLEQNFRYGYTPPDGYQPICSFRQGFETCDDRERNMPYHRCAGEFYASYVSDSPFHRIFGSTREFGPMDGTGVVLPEGYYKITLRSRIRHQVDQYIKENGRSWYNSSSIPEELRKLGDGSIIVVTACYYAKLWAAFSCIRESFQFTNRHIDLRRRRPGEDVYEWDIMGTALGMLTASGPSLNALKAGKATDFDQCVALGGVSVRVEAPLPPASSSLFKKAITLFRQ